MQPLWGRGASSVFVQGSGGDGALQAYPALECVCCGKTQPDDEAIDWTDAVPTRLRERCEEIKSENRIKVAILNAT